MALGTRSPYPHALCYVLKLHRGGTLHGGGLHGVLEHVASGEVIHFESGAALQAALTAHVGRVLEDTEPPGAAEEA